MNLFYDFELEDAFDISDYPLRVRQMYKEVKTFIWQRFSVLEDELVRQSEIGNPYVIIIQLPTEEKGLGLVFHNIKCDTLEKITQCLPDQDVDYLTAKILGTSR